MKFTIPGDPHGKARPRFANGHAYTPAKTVSYERLVKQCYMTAHSRPVTPLDTPVMLTIDVYHAVPNSASKKRQGAMLSGEVHPCIKCDLDNVIKIVMDGLQNCAYIDDKQVIGIVARKYYATEARVEVRVESI
jgi:Holliday junction resolvase RusA-like endonuclease